MTTEVKPMRCVSCGADTFRLLTANETVRIVAECVGCQSVSHIGPAPARLRIEWEDDSEGRAGVF
jgi:hypothetical protein